MSSSWIPVALSPDLPPGVAIPVSTTWGDLALWRSATGRLACWPDRCPHRGMRLSHGFVRGELLSCIYHGWRFDAAGQCRKIPAHPDLEPPAAIRVAHFPCVEAGGVIWIAREEPAAPPQVPEGLEPLRSLQIVAPVSRVRAEDAAGLTLLLQEMPGATGVHALVAPGADRGAASRALEALRRRVEAAEEEAA